VASILLAAIVPETASACAACLASQSEEIRYAFLWTTGFLSVLPVAMLGLAVLWLRRRAREAERRDSPEAAGSG
jgi:hypothetical protein